MNEEEAYSLLKNAADKMYNAIWRKYDEDKKLLEQNSISYKEFGKVLDYASASALKEFLEKEHYYPKVYSEEWFQDYNPKEDTILIVDPIDGTSNFSRGIKYSAVSLALADGDTFNDIFAGYVLNIFTKEEYFAYRGSGAFKNKSIKLHTSNTLKTIDAFISIAITHQIPGVSKGLEILKYTNYPRHLGSAALEDCLVAEGILDAHIDVRGNLRVYDIAASQLIVRESGGKVWIRQNGSDPNISKIYNIMIISTSTPHLLEKILDIIGF